MTNVYYVDGVSRVTLNGSMAHLEFFTTLPPEKDTEQPKLVVTHRVAMCLPQFAKMCADMACRLREIEKKGLVKAHKLS